jgi:hypothetical protein
VLSPTSHEQSRREAVFAAVLSHIREGRTIRLPAFDSERASPSGSAARIAPVLDEWPENPFGGTVGPFRYQIEGEDDLLHVIVSRSSGDSISPEEGQQVMTFLFPMLAPGVVWLKPGERSQHFYFGHDELL